MSAMRVVKVKLTCTLELPDSLDTSRLAPNDFAERGLMSVLKKGEQALIRPGAHLALTYPRAKKVPS